MPFSLLPLYGGSKSRLQSSDLKSPLYFREGSSDKVYQAAIESKDGGFTVNFAYGRRGSTLSTGTKTQAPVSHAETKAIYDKLLKEGTAKGYTLGADGTPYQQTDKADQATGIHCQLLNPIEEEQVEALIEDSAYWMQEKWDGRRLLVYKQEGKITGINRRGLAVALPELLVRDAQACPEDFTIDGEAIGDVLRAFDVMLIVDDDVRGRRYTERLVILANLLGTFAHPGKVRMPHSRSFSCTLGRVSTRSSNDFDVAS